MVLVNSPQFTLVLHEIRPSSIPSVSGGGWVGGLETNYR